MREPWDIYWHHWCEAAGAGRDGREPAALAERRRVAAAETLWTLRGVHDWSLVHSRVMVGRFEEAAERWAGRGGTAEELREALRSAWLRAREVRRLEGERRTTTEAILLAS